MEVDVAQLAVCLPVDQCTYPGRLSTHRRMAHAVAHFGADGSNGSGNGRRTAKAARAVWLVVA